MNELRLGNKIQTMRTERDLSVRKLAALAGITPSMLSQIENEQANPSVNTLNAIARALEVSLSALFREEPAVDPIVHPENRRVISYKGNPGVVYELLTPDLKGNLEFGLLTVPPGKNSHTVYLGHAGEEMEIMLSGDRAELYLDGKVYTMHPGDSVRIPPNTPHMLYNPSEEPVQIIFAVTPPSI